MMFATAFGTHPTDEERTPESFEHVLTGDDIPPVAREQGIDRLAIVYTPDIIDNERIWPECIEVHMHNIVAVTRVVSLTREMSIVRPSLDVIPDDQEDIPLETPLSAAQQSEIIHRLFEGEWSLLEAEGPEGDYARRLDFMLVSAPRPAPEDIVLIQDIINMLAP